MTTTRTRNYRRLRATQGCLTDCVAYFVNRHPATVPYFVYPRKGWSSRLRRFFKAYGYDIRWEKNSAVPRQGTVIVCGDSLKYKTFAHCVVYRNGRLAYDPQYPSQWKASRITHRLVIEKFTHGAD